MDTATADRSAGNSAFVVYRDDGDTFPVAAGGSASTSAGSSAPVASIATLANWLTNGFWQNQSALPHHWASNTITYNLGNLNAQEQALAVAALTAWQDVANITFVAVASGANINFNHNGTMQAVTSASWTGTGAMTSATVDISTDWVTTDGGANDGKTGIDSYAYQTYIHEIGHALGLGHQGPYNGSASYSVDAIYANDTWQYSIMSYFSEPNYSGSSYRYVITPQMADIYAVAQMYGAATTTRTGDTVYGFNSTAGSIYNFASYTQAPALTIYDSGGIDTLDCSGYSNNQTIDLRAGNFSSVGGLTNNIGIALGVIIEKAIGGSGNDTLIANNSGCTLSGGGGNDTLIGGTGNDRFVGGTGRDTMTGNGGLDTFVFATGQSSAAAGQHDLITDFVHGDLIDLSAMGTFHFLGTAAFDGVAGALNYFFNSSTGVTTLQGDINGDGVADFAIDLTGNIAIGSADLIGARTGPVVTASTAPLPHGTVSVAASSLFTVTGGDGPIQSYRFWDGTTDPNSGHFELNGVAVPQSLSSFEISAAQLANLTYVPGTVADELWVKANDGQGFGAWTVFTKSAPVNHAPVVTASTALFSAGTTSVAASSLFTVNDADGDAIQTYRFWDGTTDPNSGHFELNGVVVPQSGASFEISAAQLANLTYVPGTVADELWVKASDGQAFGAWTIFTKNPPVNHAPVVTASATPLPRGTTSVAASSLFTVSDADGDPIQTYRFWDGTTDPNSGHFELNGVVVPQSGASFEISAAQLANLTYVPGTVADELWVKASDGLAFGAWTIFTKNPPVNHAPVVTASATALPHGTTSVAASSLFTVNDADGDATQTYRFWDGTTDPNSGHFELNGVAVPQSLSSFEISAAQLANLTYVPGTVADELWVKASDGQAFGNWTIFTKNPPASQVPLASASEDKFSFSDSSVSAAPHMTTDAVGEGSDNWAAYVENLRATQDSAATHSLDHLSHTTEAFHFLIHA